MTQPPRWSLKVTGQSPELVSCYLSACKHSLGSVLVSANDMHSSPKPLPLTKVYKALSASHEINGPAPSTSSLDQARTGIRPHPPA